MFAVILKIQKVKGLMKSELVLHVLMLMVMVIMLKKVVAHL